MRDRLHKWLIFLPLFAAVFIAPRCERHASERTPIGVVVPLTGPSGKYGGWIREGLELAAKVQREENHIDLQLIYEDDQAKPANAVAAMNKLVTVNHAPVVFGSWASSCALAQAPIAERTHTVLMAEAISPKLRDAGDFVFRIQPDAREYLHVLVPYVVQTLGLKRIAILYINNDFGVDQADVFHRDAMKLGAQIVASNTYDVSTKDFSAVLNTLLPQAPDALFIAGYAETGTIVRQARQARFAGTLIGSVPTENPDLIKTAGSFAEGIIFPSHFDENSTAPATRAFQDKYLKVYGRKAEGFAALAYDGLSILALAVRNCARDAPCIRTKLYETRDFNGVTGATSFDEHGDVKKPIYIKTVRAGNFVVVQGGR